MTRSSTLALVTLLVGLLSLVSVTVVSADRPCTGYAQEHCEQMAAAREVTLVALNVAAPRHILTANGIGQEQFEAMTAGQGILFSDAAPATVHILTTNGVGQEHYEEMMAEKVATN